MSTGKVLLGLVAGVTAGAALGILFAPEKGSVTRKQISQKGEDLMDNLKSKFEDFLSSVINELEDAKSDAEAMFDKGKEIAVEVGNEMNQTANPY